MLQSCGASTRAECLQEIYGVSMCPLQVKSTGIPFVEGPIMPEGDFLDGTSALLWEGKYGGVSSPMASSFTVRFDIPNTIDDSSPSYKFYGRTKIRFVVFQQDIEWTGTCIPLFSTLIATGEATPADQSPRFLSPLSVQAVPIKSAVRDDGSILNYGLKILIGLNQDLKFKDSFSYTLIFTGTPLFNNLDLALFEAIFTGSEKVPGKSDVKVESTGGEDIYWDYLKKPNTFWGGIITSKPKVNFPDARVLTTTLILGANPDQEGAIIPWVRCLEGFPISNIKITTDVELSFDIHAPPDHKVTKTVVYAIFSYKTDGVPKCLPNTLAFMNDNLQSKVTGKFQDETNVTVHPWAGDAVPNSLFAGGFRLRSESENTRFSENIFIIDWDFGDVLAEVPISIYPNISLTVADESLFRYLKYSIVILDSSVQITLNFSYFLPSSIHDWIDIQFVAVVSGWRPDPENWIYPQIYATQNNYKIMRSYSEKFGILGLLKDRKCLTSDCGVPGDFDNCVNKAATSGDQHEKKAISALDLFNGLWVSYLAEAKKNLPPWNTPPHWQSFVELYTALLTARTHARSAWLTAQAYSWDTSNYYCVHLQCGVLVSNQLKQYISFLQALRTTEVNLQDIWKTLYGTAAPLPMPVTSNPVSWDCSQELKGVRCSGAPRIVAGPVLKPDWPWNNSEDTFAGSCKYPQLECVAGGCVQVLAGNDEAAPSSPRKNKHRAARPTLCRPLGLSQRSNMCCGPGVLKWDQRTTRRMCPCSGYVAAHSNMYSSFESNCRCRVRRYPVKQWLRRGGATRRTDCL